MTLEASLRSVSVLGAASPATTPSATATTPMARIERVLSMIRSRAQDWNREAERIALQKLSNRKEQLEKAGALSLGYPVAPRPAAPRPATGGAVAGTPVEHFDVFLSHASEDKDTIGRPLCQALTAAGVSVWFDEAVLKLGDSLRQKIDEGLARCKYGIVVLSPSRRELLKREAPALLSAQGHQPAEAPRRLHAPYVPQRLAVLGPLGC